MFRAGCGCSTRCKASGGAGRACHWSLALPRTAPALDAQDAGNCCKGLPSVEREREVSKWAPSGAGFVPQPAAPPMGSLALQVGDRCHHRFAAVQRHRPWSRPCGSQPSWSTSAPARGAREPGLHGGSLGQVEISPATQLVHVPPHVSPWPRIRLGTATVPRGAVPPGDGDALARAPHGASRKASSRTSRG